jgi:5-methylthioadenosine/S-adenosylhomocysteine deaminase
MKISKWSGLVTTKPQYNTQNHQFGSLSLEQVNIILTGGTVVTMDDRYRVIPQGALAIRDSQIIAVGTAADIGTQFHADQVIDCTNQYILPGLINAHTHVPMTLLRGLADDLRLDVWLMGYIMPTEREFVNAEFCRLGTTLACAEMIRGGVTAFAEMYYFEGEIAAATAAAGLRAVLGQSILKFPAPDAETYEDAVRYARQFIEQWRNHPLITPCIAPHAPYSTTREILQACTQVALDYDVPLMIHLAETRAEVEDCIREHGTSVIHWMEQVGVLRAKVIAAHSVAVDAAEINLMAQRGVSAAHNPSANLKLASGIAPVNQMLKAGVNVAIGTDGPASNNDLDMFEEMRLAALLAKIPAEDPTAVPAKQALTMATRNGARALRIDHLVGSLEAGKLADVIVVDAHRTHNFPHYNINPEAVYSQLVYAAKAQDVAHTLCNGRWLMRDRQLLTIDEPAVMSVAQEYAERVGRFLSAREQDVVSKLLAIGGIERSESFEVQAKAVLRDIDAVEDLLDHKSSQVIKSVHYRQYDTYFLFEDESKGRVRYREDDLMTTDGAVKNVRARLTFTTANKERTFDSAVVLSHSRFIADADRPLRFYREYFQPSGERELHKERKRWHIMYKGVPFFVNVDRVLHPKLEGLFIEIKSRTWSLGDAQQKAVLIQEMLAIMNIDPNEIVTDEYVQMKTH